MSAYWPFWAGAGALAGVGSLHFLLTGRTLGISGAYQRVVNAKEEARAERAEAALAADPEGFEAALLAATAAQFGSDAIDGGAPEAAEDCSVSATPSLQGRVPWTASALLLAMLFVGAALARLLSAGSLSVQWSMGSTFEAFFGSGARGAAVLVFGGVLVGFGTRMAGGCTSGHGLSGVSRLQASSLVATAAFFGTGVVVSQVLFRVFG